MTVKQFRTHVACGLLALVLALGINLAWGGENAHEGWEGESLPEYAELLMLNDGPCTIIAGLYDTVDEKVLPGEDEAIELAPNGGEYRIELVIGRKYEIFIADICNGTQFLGWFVMQKGGKIHICPGCVEH